MDNIIDIVFCQKLAKLFYAVANADRRIDKKEYDMFKATAKSIEFEFVSLGLKCDIDMYEHLTATFNELYLEQQKSQMCYNDFISYKEANEHLFTRKVKDLILTAAGQISTSFSGQNKSELMMLANLSLAFKN